MTLNEVKEFEALKKRLKKCKIYAIAFLFAGFLSAIISAIEFSLIQDMACDMNFVIEMHNQKNHELNAIHGIAK